MIKMLKFLYICNMYTLFWGYKFIVITDLKRSIFDFMSSFLNRKSKQSKIKRNFYKSENIITLRLELFY